ncbi:type I restriction enzyme S subunit [Bacillus thermophilus]|uniref:Type I restriction enzyme S subunit n=1 Tax=Siminovitchia thermophila TaxID=1245522 RepID=A0ABS2RCR0_9BACI|nr:restriction endonuclease subunit S [Siminovitchia thermophila]MBM7717442.1 type I restriction enzyme S subunit [Siminovitchia thermophila]
MLTTSKEKKIKGIGSIPLDWEVTKLSGITEFITKGTTPTTYGFQWEEEGIPFFKSDCIKEGKFVYGDFQYISKEAHDALNRSKIQKGDILISITGDVGKVAIIPEAIDEGNINQHVARIRVKKGEISRDFIYHWLNQINVRNYYNVIKTGLAYPQISLEQVRNTEIPIPKKTEQQKIASILSTWDKAIELKEKLIEQKKEQKKGLMQKLLTGEVRLPGFEGEWREVNLAKVSKRIKGKAVEYLENGKFPAIDMDYLESGLFKNFSNDATVFAKKNDVLLLWDGSRAGMAFTGVEGAVGSTFVKLECKSIHNIFLQKHLEMNERKIQRLREGSGIPHVPKDFLNFYKIKMPSMDEQKAISNVLNNMDKNLEFLQKEIVYLKQQKQGLMQQLLTGKVRVKV